MTDAEKRIKAAEEAFTNDRKQCPKCKKETLVYFGAYARPQGEGQKDQIVLMYQCEDEDCVHQEQHIQVD